MPPPVAFAACEEHVFRRDFTAQKWLPVDDQNKPSRVQFMKRDNSYFMRLIANGERIDYALSRESRLHSSPDGSGFLQIPLADAKELYAIKFRDTVDGDAFYAKIVNEMDMPWSSPRTTIGPDKLPNPAVNFGPTTLPNHTVNFGPTTLPPPTSNGNRRIEPTIIRPQNQPSINPSPLQPGGFQQPPRFNNAPLRPGPPKKNAVDMVDQPPPVVRNPVVRNQAPLPPREYTNQPMANSFSGHPPQELLAQNQWGRSYGPGPNNSGPQPGGMNRGNFNPQSQPQQNYGQPQYRNAPQQQHQQMSYNASTIDPYHRGNQPGGGGYNQGGQIPQAGGQRPPKINPQIRRPREPEPVEEAQLGTLAVSLMNAINQGNEGQAQRLLASALQVKANLRIQCEKGTKQEPEPEFMLEVVVEFQQPQKTPLSVFLDKICESFTIFDLQTMVEQKFHIPRSSQNWIIGDKLIKSDDRQPLSSYGLKCVKGSDSQQIIYLYVMHTKKANVAKEDLEAIQTRQRAQQNKQQSGVQAPLPPAIQAPNNRQGQQADYSQAQQANYPQGQQPNYPQGQRVNYSQGQQPNYPQGQRVNYSQGGQHMMGPMHGQMVGDPNQSGFPQAPSHDRGYQGQGNFPQDNMGPPQQFGGDPTYDKIGNRGYNPGFTDSGLPKFRAQQDPLPVQYPPQFDEPVYEQLNQGVLPVLQNPPVQGARKPPPPVAVSVLPHVDVLSRGPDQPNPQAVLGVPSQLNLAPPIIKEKPGWKCSVCTYHNKPRRPGCEMCTAPRPADYDVPDDTPLDTLQLDEQKNDELFQEYEKLEGERKKDEAIRNYQALIQAEDADVVTNKEEFECMICYVPTEPGEGVILRECLHEFCKGCLHDTIINTGTAVVGCPFDDGNYQCHTAVSEREMRTVLSDEELEAVQRRGLREAENASPNSFHCKTPDCTAFCFYEDDVNEFQCPVCNKRNCLLCKAIHEGMDCKEYQDDLKRRAANDEAAMATQMMLEGLVKNGEAMNCPQCKIIVQKKDGCDWIRCSMCRTEICWATKGRRWGPAGTGDKSGGCQCRVGGKKCTPTCRNCH